jgi:hypothetical protein
VVELAPRPTPIVGLFKPCSPTTIVGRVRTVIVLAIECVSARRTRSHISKEQNKIFPSFAHCNAACSVVFEAFIIWVAAATQHACPDVIFRQAMRLAMCTELLSRCFGSKASTRSSAAVTQITTRRRCFATAVTKTIPRLFVGIIDKRNQASETLIRNINELWHIASLAHP